MLAIIVSKKVASANVSVMEAHPSTNKRQSHRTVKVIAQVLVEPLDVRPLQILNGLDAATVRPTRTAQNMRSAQSIQLVDNLVKFVNIFQLNSNLYLKFCSSVKTNTGQSQKARKKQRKNLSIKKFRLYFPAKTF